MVYPDLATIPTRIWVTDTINTRTDYLARKLRGIEMRMSIVVGERRHVRNLLADVEESYPDMAPALDAFIQAVREHLDLSERFEEAEIAEERAKRSGAWTPAARAEVDTLLKQVYDSWRRFHSAYIHFVDGLTRNATEVGSL